MPPFDTLLAGLARERASGSLRLGRTGTVFLADGRVTYMESAQTPGVEDILAARGRVTVAALRRAQKEGDGQALLEDGALSRGELQFCVLSAVLDAAYFLLPAKGARPKFRPGERHWLDTQWYFEVAGLVRECARRRTRLAAIWPSADFDTTPVTAVRRLPGHRAVLGELEWQLLVNADGQTTPLELARRIGCPAYSVLLAVRRLAAAGLITAADPTLPTRPGRDPAEERPPVPQADPTDLDVLIRLKKALEELS